MLQAVNTIATCLKNHYVFYHLHVYITVKKKICILSPIYKCSVPYLTLNLHVWWKRLK